MSDLIVPRVFRRDTNLLCSSEDVGKHFGKRHYHLMRDIRDILAKIPPKDGDMSWFRESTILDSYGREQPSYDMTKDGFALLVMGWTGEKAMAFKIAYIAEFNRMEQGAHHLLEDQTEPDASKLAKVREARRTHGKRFAARLWFDLGLPGDRAASETLRQPDLPLIFDDTPAADATEVN